MEDHVKFKREVIDAQLKAINELCIISLSDRSGVITYANDLFCMISGYSIEELVGEPHSIINSGYHEKEFFIDMWTTISSGRVWRGEICNQAKGGSYYWVDSTIVPAFNAYGEVEQYIGIRYDITQRKTIESSLTRSFKMATLGAVSGCIAHEIKNPLAVISGKSSNLLSQIEAGKLSQLKLKEDLICIEKTAQQMVRIVNGIGTLSHDDNSEIPVKVSISSILWDTLELCQARIQNSEILIKTNGDLNLLLVCRPVQISQVLLNLICNAIDAIEDLVEKWIIIQIKNEESSVEISVTDSGKGINSEVSDKIMNPFFTTKPVGKGTGLGLSISKKIIESNNGVLRYDPSCANTRFSIHLPKIIESF
jgi:PAS domain S-box-containing protein